MNAYWYHGLPLKARIAIIIAGVIAALYLLGGLALLLNMAMDAWM